MLRRFTQISKPLLVRGLHPLLRRNSVDVRVGVLVSHTIPRIPPGPAEAGAGILKLLAPRVIRKSRLAN